MKKILVFALAAMMGIASASAQTGKSYNLRTYTPTDGGILTNVTANGEWAVINLGTTSGGGNADSQVYNVATGQHTTVKYNAQVLSFNAVSNDGNTVVGSYGGKAMAYNRATGKMTVFPQRKYWQMGELTAITPDGKWAVGAYEGYSRFASVGGEDDVDFSYSTLLVNVETGDTIATPGLPAKNLYGSDENSIVFTAISPDGRYLLGKKDWYYMQPNCPLHFIYDTQEHTYKVLAFNATERGYVPVAENIHHVEDVVMSPNGKWLAGDLWMAEDRGDGSGFMNEYITPFKYNLETGEFVHFTDVESNNCSVGCIDDEGTIMGNPETGGPLRNTRIFYRDKYWVPLTQVCEQHYGFNFSQKTGYEYSGTATSISGNGQVFVAFSDPNGESYVFDLGEPIENVCGGIDMFSNYTVSPEKGAYFSQMTSVDINFGRPIQVLGKGNTHFHLYKKGKNGEADTKVRDGLSTVLGLALKENSSTTLRASIRTTNLEAGEEYYIVLDAGAVGLAADADITNKEIRVTYFGRSNAPVKVVKASPVEGAELRQLDNSGSYVLLTFDSPVKLTNKAYAYLENTDDHVRMASLAIASGNTASTKNQIILQPSNINYLYKGQHYRVVLEAGSVCDLADTDISLNQEFELNFVGTYVREVVNKSVMFSDDFNSPNNSLTLWLQYEGDNLMPSEDMQAWGFKQYDTPWNFTTRDDETTSDYFATSHSMYTTDAPANDWMLTPQLIMPDDGKAVVEFDAQSYYTSYNDHLKVYVYESDKVLSYINNETIMADIKANAVLLDDIKLSAGPNPGITAGEWTHYKYSLSDWAGKNIYIAFVNQNQSQSAVFVDNVIVQREVLYSVGFNNEERVTAREDINIYGQFTIKDASFEGGDVKLVLKDSNGNEVSTVEWKNLTADAKEKPMEFSFDKALPLTIGAVNDFTIDVTLGSRFDVFKGSIHNLAFQPVKRVVLEKKTGTGCQFCPLGIMSIEECEKTYGDRFIPVAIHSYEGGDVLGSNLLDYSNFLGLSGAPTARINRIAGSYSPAYTTSEHMYLDRAEEDLWYNIVGQQLNILSECDVDLKAVFANDSKTSVKFTTDVKYALNATGQQLSLFIVLLENGVVSMQSNGIYLNSWPELGEWGQGGAYGSAYAFNVTHNDVARATYGQTYSGTIGLYPTAFEAGKVYSTTTSGSVPASVRDASNLYAVAMIINSQTGEVINAARAKVQTQAEYDGIDAVEADSSADAPIYNLSGAMMGRGMDTLRTLPAGIYVVSGKKYLIK